MYDKTNSELSHRYNRLCHAMNGTSSMRLRAYGAAVSTVSISPHALTSRITGTSSPRIRRSSVIRAVSSGSSHLLSSSRLRLTLHIDRCLPKEDHSC